MLSLPEKYIKCAENLEKEAYPLDMLFHYTNRSGLHGILRSQQLWLGHFTQLNDTSEVHHALKVIRNFIFSQVIERKLRGFWESLFEDIEGFILNEYDFFAFSLCMKKNWLSAWRNYSDDGTGFSIGFNRDFFLGISTRNEVSANAPPFGRSKVYYDFKSVERDIRYLVKITQNDLEELGALYDTDKARANRVLIAKFFMSSLMPFFSAIKHPSYEEEHEHRIYTSMPRSVSLQTFYIPASNPGELPRKKVYFEFALNSISEIWVGPQLNFGDAKQDVSNLLDELREEGKCTNDIKIFPSELPYKNR